MNEDVRKLAWRQYVHYFRIWFIIAAVCLVLTGGAAARSAVTRSAYLSQIRGNVQAPAERVYDFADVLTDAEEQQLREYIAECEARAHADFIIVTMDIPMGVTDAEWENNMMNCADDFYDNYMYGWNMAYGDGALLLDNWYEDENVKKGSWLSTAGKMEDIIGRSEEDMVFDDMYAYIDSNPYEAYRAALSRLADYGEYGYKRDYTGEGVSGGLLCFGIVLPIIVALIYATTNLKQEAAKDTTVPTTYVVTGRARVNRTQDQFLRKNVTSHRIESSSSGGGSSSRGHSGGGSHGHHTSSGGHSHGGGGRRR